MVRVEVCANSVQSAIEAEKGGAVRVELCGNLPDGGTTPAKSQIELARESLSIDLNVIIRPRGGDFLYDNVDFESMKRDIQLCGEIKCDGVVIGMLDADGNIDKERNAVLVDIAKKFGMSVTFHRAFDRVKDITLALDDVIKLGCNRILTSGGYLNAYDGREVIRDLVRLSGDKIIIMAGSGVNENNVSDLITYTGVKEVHGTFQTFASGGMNFHNPHFIDSAEYGFLLSDSLRVNEIVRKANF